MIWRAIAVVCVAALALAGLPLLRHFRETPPPPPPAVRLSLTAPPGTELGVGEEVLDAAISPDGREMVFVATLNGVTQLWRRGFDTEGAEVLKGHGGSRAAGVESQRPRRVVLCRRQAQTVAEPTAASAI